MRVRDLVRMPLFITFGAILLTTSSVWAQRPNVLFIAIDDLNDWVGCLGGYPGRVHTPNIDALAKRGVIFTNAHCASPVCCPSRTAALSGLLPSTTGIYNNQQWWKPHRPNLTTLPSHFRTHGYRIIAAGKLFHHTAGNHPPDQWDHFHRLVFKDDPWFRSHPLNYPWSQPAAHPPGFPFSQVPELPHENDWGVLPDKATADYDDSQSVAFITDWLRQPSDGPQFFACGLFRPHLPWYAPKSFFALYPQDEIQLPSVANDDLNDVPQEGVHLARARQDDLRKIQSANRYREAVRAYLTSVSFADYQVGQLISALEASPHAKNTVMVLWSDHGWHLGEKSHWHKSTLWEEATRVPLIIAGPGIAPGRCQAPVSLVDLFPTLNELCELPAVPHLDGRTLTPLLEAPSRTDGVALVQFRPGQCAIRTHRYRYIRYADGGEELYDHATDPGEHHNLSADATAASLKAELQAHVPTRWAPPAPRKNAYRFDPKAFTWEKANGEIISGH